MPIMQDVWEPFQGSDLLNALTPERGTPQQLPKVRTLGWDSLAIDYTFLCKAVAASLDALNVPHSQVSLSTQHEWHFNTNSPTSSVD